MSRLVYWGDCDDFEGCGTQTVIQPNPENTTELPPRRDWETIGWPDCPVCGGPASFGGAQGEDE